MKNMILGLAGCMILIYSMVITMSISTITLRKNAMEHGVSAAMQSIMTDYYVPAVIETYAGGSMQYRNAAADEEVEEKLIAEISRRLGSDNHAVTEIKVCNMEKGIISVEVSEEIQLPTGTEKVIRCSRTIIADRIAEK